MTNEAFIERAKDLVVQYISEHFEKPEVPAQLYHVQLYHVFVVWNAYILGNIKCLISTDRKDGMYYEVTYNRDKREIYFDAYEKVGNTAIMD